ncbi:MAG: 4Fe-4S binding protein [Desulfobacteraceae bacterium]|jgi:2-oxoacid:acceptor oxidoreductase delta subunit (pyruvate/2-ketoisovalerate family)
MPSSQHAFLTCRPAENLPSGWDRATPLTEEHVPLEASRCLSLLSCDSCDLCRLFCPDLCITRNPETGRIEIDYDYCKGCGICALVCPKGAIRMELEA